MNFGCKKLESGDMVNNNKLLNIYLAGSNVYGTATEKSDVDYIYVVDHQDKSEDQLLLGKTNITIYPVEYFQHKINECSVSALECFFLPEKFKIELYKPTLNLDLEKLRRSFSEKSSNSWVKAKKKIDVHQEYYLGMKSLFHSLRIINFGIQIAQFGKINDYSAANPWWNKIVEQNFKTWQEYKESWQNTYNNLHSAFRSMAPLEK